MTGEGGLRRLMTVPNVLCFLRLLGAPVVVVLAATGRREAFLLLVAVLFLTDWLDGKLAVLLDEETTFGARLDTVADALFYASLVPAVWWLERESFLAIGWWIATALASYAVNGIVALAVFRSWPSYHTRAAKISWFLTLLGAASLFLGGPLWIAEAAAAWIVATNVEGVAITAVLPEWRANVAGLWVALRIRREGESAGRRSGDVSPGE